MKHTTVHYVIPEGKSLKEFRVNENSSLTLVISAINVQNIDASVSVRLLHQGASATIIGVVMGDMNADINLHTLQKHEAPDTTSNLLVKSALKGSARCVIDGGIRVEKKAQKTNAYQRNENLLLSGDAYAESKPALEILANDVRCTHGATVGPISPDELWYLATRGIGKAKAEALIVEGFFRSALDLVSDESVRYRILQRVLGAIE